MENLKQNQKSTKIKNILLVVLGLLVVALLVDKLMQKQKTDEIITQLEDSNTEKQNLNDELKGLYEQYEGLKTNNDSINEKLEVEKKKIAELMTELKYVKTSNLQKLRSIKRKLTRYARSCEATLSRLIHYIPEISYLWLKIRK
jgi:uncharacterized coiled-coil DUF342 family protein